MSDDVETQPQPPVREGEILAGKYRVEHVLGIGGMGVVVAARHLELDQPVALKFLLPMALSKTVVVERFAREARAAVRLKSEHVARVIDVGKLPGGEPYMVMELLDGVDLATLLETSGPLAPADAVDYVLQACEAVAEAHALGIIHRDLKPRNLFLTKRVDGRPLVKVLDFGISKVAEAATSQPKLSLTRTSEVMGSPMYMSPEQLRSARDVDERTDIWALGVIIYELLTGAVPFEAETVTQLCAMVLQDEPRPLQQVRPDVPAGLAAVVARCLEKAPALRFSSIADLADALDEFTSPDSRGAARRIRRVTDESSPRSLGAASMRGPVSQRVSVSGGTSVSWGETEYAGLPHKKSSRRARWIPIGAGVAGVITIGVLAVLLARSGSHPAAQPEPTASVATSASKPNDPIAPTANGLPMSPPSASVAVTGVSPSASATTTTQKIGLSPIALTTKPTTSTAPIASTPPKPTATAVTTATVGGNRPKDDMPSDRH